MIELIIFIIIIGIIALFYLFSNLNTKEDKEDKEYIERLEKSLDDEYIIDPETGAKLTLEEAESGNWNYQDDESRIVPQSEIDTIPSKQEQQFQIALNYLKGNIDYKQIRLSEEQVAVLEKTITLTNYDDWSYPNSFEFNEGVVFLPTCAISGEITYYETYLMYWVKIHNITGHYFFREKHSIEKFVDFIKSDDEIELSNYECFTINKSYNLTLIKKLLNSFENVKGLELEFHDDNFFIKTTKPVNLDDMLMLEKLIKQLKEFA